MKKILFLIIVGFTITNVYCQSLGNQSNLPISADSFQSSMKFYGDYLIIGNPKSSYHENNAGVAYIFKNISGNYWEEKAVLTPNDLTTDDYFGFSVDINENYAIVGAAFKDDTLSKSGSAYIFKNENDNWTQIAKLNPNNNDSLIGFGTSVSITDNYAFVGASGYYFSSSDTGKVYVFENKNDEWLQTAVLKSSDSRSSDFFGWDIEITDTIAVIGARHTGAYVFKNKNGDWAEQTKLYSSNLSNSGRFGKTVSLYGNYIMVGAEDDSINGKDGAGSACIFKYENNIWVEKQKLIDQSPQTTDYFGYTVAITDSFAAVTTIYYETSNTGLLGSVSFYKNNNDNWEFIERITPLTEVYFMNFGIKLDISNNFLVTTNKWGTIYLYPIVKPEILNVVYNKNHDNFNIYPNPTNDNFYIESDIDYSDINIYSLNGKLIKTLKKQSAFDNKFIVSDIKRGLYIIKVSRNNVVYHSQLLIFE